MDLKADNAAAPDAGGASHASRLAAGISGVEVKLSPGGPAELIKLTEVEALVETPSRFSIGASVALCIGGPSPRRLPGRVLRCQVCGIHRDNTMIYQIGVSFDAAAPAESAEPPSVATTNGAADIVAAVNAAGRSETDELVNEW